ncbi:MAG: hypothetical protein JXP34_28185 [Planctomycetes bacterium]|nr:hypothetical protein [Planctomycetota bacterium]
MSESTPKAFDCVEAVRITRDRMSAEIAGMDYQQVVRWLRSHRYVDPFLARLAERASREAGAASPRR